MRRIVLPVFVVAVILGGSLSSWPHVDAEPLLDPAFADHKVAMGAEDPDAAASGAPRFEYHAYYPARLEVHRGDVVWFDEVGTHSVSFFPDGQRVDQLMTPDEVPGDVAVHAGTPSSGDCALYDDLSRPPCVLSSTDQYLSTGVNFLARGGGRIEFDLDEGEYTYFCSIHPDMAGTIAVVADDVAVASPEQVEAARQDQIVVDTEAGEAMLTSFDGPDHEVLPDGSVRWEVLVGGSTADGRVSSKRFLPGALEIAPGDEIEFVVGPTYEGVHEFHSASFMPREQAEQAGFGNYLHFSCDPDDPSAGLPGVRTSAAAAFTGCPPGTTSELVYYPWAYREPFATPDDQVVGQLPIHDSGILVFDDGSCLGSCDPWTGDRLPDRSRATFPVAGAYTAFCVIHAPDGMAVSVTVAPPS